jgi:hypothetical protein
MSKDLERAWKAACAVETARRKSLMERASAAVLQLLQAAQESIALKLASQPTDYQLWHLSSLNVEIERILSAFSDQSGSVVSNAAGDVWSAGVDLVDNPVSAAGITARLPQLDTELLTSLRTFMVDRIKDVGTVAAQRIKTDLGMALIGAQPIHETIKRVGDQLADSGASRANMIVRDNLSRAWAMAGNDRAQQYTDYGVDLDKVWRRSGKIHSRLAHDLLDGKRVAMDGVFISNGHSLRYPHDPKAPLGEVINCGCICLYRPRALSATLPAQRPFTAQELALNPNKATIQNGATLNSLAEKNGRS